MRAGDTMSNVEYFYATHSAYVCLGSAKFMGIMASAGRGITIPPNLANQGPREFEFPHREVKPPSFPAKDTAVRR